MPTEVTIRHRSYISKNTFHLSHILSLIFGLLSSTRADFTSSSHAFTIVHRFVAFFLKKKTSAMQRVGITVQGFCLICDRMKRGNRSTPAVVESLTIFKLTKNSVLFTLTISSRLFGTKSKNVFEILYFRILPPGISACGVWNRNSITSFNHHDLGPSIGNY